MQPRAETPLQALPKRFELARHLGSGGMGAVYEAFDHERGARVALKTLRSPRPDALLHLKNEFRALQNVRHQNLVHLLELVEDEGRFFVVMELVEGHSFLSYCGLGAFEPILSGFSETRQTELARPPDGETAASLYEPLGAPRQLMEQRLRSALVQLAEGLCALHDRGKIHRDIKPANVLVTTEGRVVLVDFGLVQDVSAVPSELAGTRAFMAPEQAAGQALTGAADWFSVGVMLHLALTGALPFAGAELQRKKLQGRAALLPLGETNVPRDLLELTLDLLDPDSARRPDGRAVLARLGQADRVVTPVAKLPFLGRSDELAELSAAFERSHDEALFTLLVGDSGLGKTALVREWLARTKQVEPRLLVFRGRCYERELVPYRAFDGIVDQLSAFLMSEGPEAALRLLPDDAWILARVFPVLSDLEILAGAEADEPAEPQALRRRAFAALRELFSRLSERKRLVLFIDDLQWADADSHLLLADLLHQPHAPRLHVIATARPPAGAADPIGTLEQRLSSVRKLSLLPLSPADSRALASRVLGTARPELCDVIAKETAGHPLFLQALAEHAKHAGGFELGAIRLDDAIYSRIERVDSGARLLLELIALAGVPVSSEIVRHAASLDQPAYAANLASLRVQRLVRTSFADGKEPVEPYHDRIRESLLPHLDGERRRGHHDRLATAMLRAAGAVDPRAVVHHLQEAGRTREAAERAELGARHAESALAFDQAAELYGVALRLSDASRHEALGVRLAEALTNAGRAAEAARAHLECAERASPGERLYHRRRAADHMLRSGHLEQGMAILADVLGELGDVLPSQRRSLVSALWQRFRLKQRGLAWTPAAADTIAPELLRRIDAYHAVGVSLSLIDTIRGSAFQARAVRLALDAGEPLRLGPILVMEVGYESSSGNRGLVRARSLIREIERIVELTGDAYVTATLRMIEGFVAYHAGEFGAAVDVLGEMELAFQKAPGRYFEQAFCHCFRAICLRNQGRFGELSKGFADWVRDAERRGDRFTEASLRFNLNGVWLARDAPDEARRDLERISWIPPRGGYHMQHWYEQQARNEIDLYTGQCREGLARMRDELKALSRSFILRIRVQRCSARWQLGRLILANVARKDAPLRALAEVARLEARLLAEKVGYATTWAELLRAGRESVLGRVERSAEALGAARTHAERHGLFHCQHAALHHLASLPGGRDAALAEPARTWAGSQSIQSPDRFFASLVPGFPS